MVKNPKLVYSENLTHDEYYAWWKASESVTTSLEKLVKENNEKILQSNYLFNIHGIQKKK